ncbi:hypothetical protein [Azospirillum argentinense]
MPKPYVIRDKKDTPDDPLDEMIAARLAETLAPGMAASKATGPLITPDMALYRPGLCDGVPAAAISSDLRRAVGIEVKRLKPTRNSDMARMSGMDFNSTPPCGTARIYTMADQPIDIRSFYLFVFECGDGSDQRQVTMMTLCDGNILNEDYNLYLATTGTRTKQIGLGTYRDGANRVRPMMIFANPFTADVLFGKVSLVHCRGDLEREFPTLFNLGRVSRTRHDGTISHFFVYRHVNDVPLGDNGFGEVLDPFRTPDRRAETAQRGRFKIDVKPRY